MEQALQEARQERRRDEAQRETGADRGEARSTAQLATAARLGQRSPYARISAGLTQVSSNPRKRFQIITRRPQQVPDGVAQLERHGTSPLPP